MTILTNNHINAGRIRWCLAIACFAVVFNFFGPDRAAAQQGPKSFAGLAEQAAHSVVNIATTQVIKGRPAMPWNTPQGPFEEFFNKYFGEMPQKRQAHALGSGFLIDDQGYIFTNYHVIAKATEIRVRLQNGKEYDAKVIGRDPKTDLALIRIKTDDQLPRPARLGDSDTIQVGDWVLAVGNPFGLGHSVTAGIIGAKGRVIGAGPYDDFLQTDAAINPGNSGGPLFNTDGQVVGINTAIVAQGQGIGFAIPINMAKDLLAQLKAGHVVRGYLGVAIQNVTPELAQAMGLKTQEGAIIANIMKDTPAAKSGLQESDVIVAVDGQPIANASELSARIAGMAPGTQASLDVIRDGKKQTVHVTIGTMPQAEAGQEEQAEQRPKWGLAIQDITPEIAQQLNLASTKGVIVSQVTSGSPADEAGIQRGDVIRAVGRQPVTSTQDFMQIIQKQKNENSLVLRVQRGDTYFYAVLDAQGQER